MVKNPPPPSGILPHNFEVCSTPLTASAIAGPAADLPNSCAGTMTLVLRPGGRAILTVDFAAVGTYEYLSTVPGNASAGMKGKLKSI
jgi:hypothetical protein